MAEHGIAFHSRDSRFVTASAQVRTLRARGGDGRVGVRGARIQYHLLVPEGSRHDPMTVHAGATQRRGRRLDGTPLNDLAHVATERGIRVQITGFVVDPPLVIVSDPRGPVIARGGSRRGVVVNAAAANVFRRLASTGVLTGSVPGDVAPGEARLLEMLAARGLARLEMSLLEPFPAVSVVVPTFGRVETLTRCLNALRRLRYPPDLIELVVVDDAHPEGASTAGEAARVGARLIRRVINGGPGAARNTGAAGSTAGLLAFVDSDCEVPSEWLTGLLPELADPAIWAVAARVVGIPDSSAVGRYEASRSPLDMGAQGHDLDAANGRLFVPLANLIVDRTVFERVGRFDDALRVGEDVDLCLRILRAGGRIRYLPAVTVGHAPRRSLAGFVRQRIVYAASEAPLVKRYPPLARALPIPLVPVSAALVLVSRPAALPIVARASVAAGLVTLQTEAWRRLSRRMSAAGPDANPTWVSSFRSTVAANARLTDGLIRQFSRHHVVPVSLLVGRFAAKRSMGAALLLLAGAGLSDYVRLRPNLDPVRFLMLHGLDDLAYNAGLLLGAYRERSLRAYLGRVRMSSGLPGSQLTDIHWDGSTLPGSPGRARPQSCEIR